MKESEWNAHVPVLLTPVIEGLRPHPNSALIDGTVGAGGHATAWLDATSPEGRLLGFDRDASALDRAAKRLERFGVRVTLIHASYAHMADLAPEHGFDTVDGILLDLGYSSLQVDDPKRGFSFRHDGPLDMRFDTSEGHTAADRVNTLPESDLADIIRCYGEEPHARRIARAIVQARPLTSTLALAEAIVSALPPARARGRIHPATRTFQALRIAVNDELSELERVLPQTLRLLGPGGRLAVISFHSLEDRIVKQFMRREAQDCICPPSQVICTCEHRATLQIIARRPITATMEEVTANPRARSAKLRIAERL